FCVHCPSQSAPDASGDALQDASRDSCPFKLIRAESRQARFHGFRVVMIPEFPGATCPNTILRLRSGSEAHITGDALRCLVKCLALYHAGRGGGGCEANPPAQL